MYARLALAHDDNGPAKFYKPNYDKPMSRYQTVRQARHAAPCFDGNHTVPGNWLVADQAFGIDIREDASLIT